MSSSEHDEIAEGLEEAQAELERASLEEQLPNTKRQRERAKALKKTRDALELARNLARRQKDESPLAGALAEMNKSTKELLAAINANTATTNALLATADARLAHLEQSVVSNHGSAFPAALRVLEEGEFLRTHLTGLLDTERPGPLFNDAVVRVTPGGFDDLSSAICTRCGDETEVG